MTHLLEMLQAGGLTAFLMGFAGVFCAVGAVYQFRYPPRKRNRILHVICSATPALLGLWVFYRMLSAYTLIAASNIAPTRAEYELVMSDAVVLGSLSILCTLIPISVAVAGLLKNPTATSLTV